MRTYEVDEEKDGRVEDLNVDTGDATNRICEGGCTASGNRCGRREKDVVSDSTGSVGQLKTKGGREQLW